MMRELAGKVKNLDTGHWITIAVLLLTGALQYGATTAQIGELSRSQARTEASEKETAVKLDSVMAEQARVKQQLADHIQMTNEHFMEMGKR